MSLFLKIPQLLKRIYKQKSSSAQQKKSKGKTDNNLDYPGSIIGKNTSIGKGTTINGHAYIRGYSSAQVTIGKYCAIAHNLRVRAQNHHTGYANIQGKLQRRYGFPKLACSKGPVNIGHNVWIGDNVIILSGVTIGHGAVIGAGAVVTKDIPPFCIAAGVPARIIKKRFNESIIEQILAIAWWDWPEDKIGRNRAFFSEDLSLLGEDYNLFSLIVD